MQQHCDASACPVCRTPFKRTCSASPATEAGIPLPSDLAAGPEVMLVFMKKPASIVFSFSSYTFSVHRPSGREQCRIDSRNRSLLDSIRPAMDDNHDNTAQPAPIRPLSDLPARHEVSPTPTLQQDGVGGHGSSSKTASTHVSSEDSEKRTVDEKDVRSHSFDEEEEEGYEQRGVFDVEDEGKKRKVRVVMEKKSGRELIKEMTGGPYTIPRWYAPPSFFATENRRRFVATNAHRLRRHSLPFVNPKHPPPQAPLSLDDVPVTPEISANWFSIFTFNWISPIMALGSARPLQPTDMPKMDAARSAGLLSDQLVANYAARQQKALEYNARLKDLNTPLPFPQRFTYPLLPHREKRENDFRAKRGTKSASLAWSLSDTFGWYFWLGGVIKVFGDTASATTPLVLRALIKWSTQWQAAQSGLADYPSYGKGVGLAIALFLMLCVASATIHHFFVRK